MKSEFININADAVVELTNKLEKLHKSAMPVAVRGTLNDAAFDMKINEIPSSFTGRFTIRKKRFINSHTAVNKSPNTFNLKQMKAEVGVIAGKSSAGDDLENLEFGGSEQREAIPFAEARVGKSENRTVSKKNLLRNIKPRNGRSKYRNQQVVKAAFAAGKGGSLVYNDVLFKVRTLGKKSGKLSIKLDPLYSYKKGRTVQIKKQPFMAPAAAETQKKMPAMYLEQARRRFEKYL